MDRPISRRSLLATGAALALAGCTIKNEPAPAPTSTPTPSTTATTATPGTTDTPTRQQTPKPAQEPTLNPATYTHAPTAFGLHLPGITDTISHGIALTFDACGGAYDAELIRTLREFQVPATLFLAQPWIHAHPQVTRELVADPLFQIENHGTRHVPLTVAGQAAYGIHGTASPAEALEEIMGNAGTLREFGVATTWFRAGTAHYDDVALRIAQDASMRIAGFSVNGDFGAKASAAQVAHAITHAGSGAIILMHMNHPGSGTARGVRQAIEHLLIDAPLPFTTLDTPHTT